MATQTSALAAPFIYESGLEVLPIGGFTGTIPEPTLANLRAEIRQGRFHLVLQSPAVRDPRFRWVAGHCARVTVPVGSTPGVPADRFNVYYCGAA
jgi:hypothetical protein